MWLVISISRCKCIGTSCSKTTFTDWSNTRTYKSMNICLVCYTNCYSATSISWTKCIICKELKCMTTTLISMWNCTCSCLNLKCSFRNYTNEEEWSIMILENSCCNSNISTTTNCLNWVSNCRNKSMWVITTRYNCVCYCRNKCMCSSVRWCSNIKCNSCCTNCSDVYSSLICRITTSWICVVRTVTILCTCKCKSIISKSDCSSYC